MSSSSRKTGRRLHRQVLSDLGERWITDNLLARRYDRRGNYFGDDCAVIRFGKRAFLYTTDPCPTPAALALGFDDLYYFGWLLATINLSDIAAMGGTPDGLLTSFILPNDTTVQQFNRLLDGVDACCSQSGTRVIGGNLKEGSLQGTATAVGHMDFDTVLWRSGVQVGDSILVAGDLGRFWAGFLARRNELPIPGSRLKRLMNPVLTPRPKIREGRILSGLGCVHAAMDVSDGLLPTLREMAKASKVNLSLELTRESIDPDALVVADLLRMDPTRLALGWGDWQLCLAVNASDIASVRAAIAPEPVHEIGKARRGTGLLLRHEDGVDRLWGEFDSERLRNDSWLTAGLQGYVDMLLDSPLSRGH